MSTQERNCRNKEAPVATNEQEEGRNSVTTRYLLSRQEIKKQYRKNTATKNFMLRHNEEHKEKSMSRQNFFCCNTNYGNMEKLVETEEELRG